MTAVEERVVRMLFDNQKFEQGVSSTLGSLDKLNKGLKLEGATKGLDEVSSAAKNLSLDHIANGVDAIAGKFKAMSVTGIAAITNLANRAVNAGINLAKSLSVNPIKAGLDEYGTTLNSIQTIMANTGLSGQKGLNKVNDALNVLNTYSDKTIYNFTEMAKNIGTFTAAGVDLKTSTSAIKGIANLAAISGSNSEQASTAMYQLSQAIAAGKVSLEDWNSVVNAGMGGKVFQQALMATARTHGVAIDKMVKDEKGFRNTLQKGWLTSDILTETLSKFTGDLTAKQLKSMGYTKKQADEILKMGKTAQDAATKVKTLPQLIDTLKEAVGSGWTKTWQLIFGDFEEARTLFTGVSNTLGGFVSASANARNKVLGDWKALGGRTVLINTIALAFHALIAVIKPIKDAFREIFPATTGKDLYNLTKSLHVFAENLLISGSTADKLKRTFAGIFAVFGIGWDILKKVASTFLDLFKSGTKGSTSILDFTAKIGDFLVAIHKAVESGTGLTTFFTRLSNILAIPIKLLRVLAEHVSDLFDRFQGVDAQNAAKSVTGLTKHLNPLGKIIDAITSGGDDLVNLLDKGLTHLGDGAKKLVVFLGNVGSAIGGFLQSGNFDFSKILTGINTGLFAGFLLLLKKFVDKFRNDDDGLGGIVDTIKESFEELTNTLKTMQNVLKATILLQIAVAIGILTASVVALSFIDTDRLKVALSALAIMFTQLFASMAVFSKLAGGTGFGKMILLGAALILIAAAVDVLVIAVTQLAKLDWKELSKGLAGVAALLISLAGAVQLMPTGSGLITAGIGLIAIAGAINLLVIAVTNLSGFSWEELGKGLAGVAGLLVSLALFTKFSDANKAGLLQGAGILLIAVAIRLLVSAIKDFSQFSWTEIGKGLSVMAGALAAIGTALYFIPPTAVFSAAGVLIVASSLGIIGDAIKGMAKISWKDIGKGLTVMAGALTLIAAALYVLPPTSLFSAAAIFIVAESLGTMTKGLEEMATMSWGDIGKSLTLLAGALTTISLAMIAMLVALPGAAALVIVVASLTLLTPILQTFGQMSWEEIAKGLLTLAGVFAVLGVAGVALAVVTPVLLSLGLAITLLGVGILATGAGVLLFATALTALSIAGTAGAAALVVIVKSMLGLLPEVAKEIGLAVIAFAKTISTAGPAITKAMVTVLTAVLNAINQTSPKIIHTLGVLMDLMISSTVKYVPKMLDAGLRLITGILNGIANNIGKIVTAASHVMEAFLQGIALNLPKIIQAGVNLVIAFINGVADAIRNNVNPLVDAGLNLGSAIIEGMLQGMAHGLGKIASAAAGIGKSAIDSAKGALHINSPSKDFIAIGKSVNEGFLKGLESGDRGRVVDSVNTLGAQLISAMKNSAQKVSDLQDKLKKLTDARKKDTKAIAETRAELAQTRLEHSREAAAYSDLTKNLVDEKNKLRGLANQYTAVTNKLKAATDTLNNAIKVRNDYNASVKTQYSALPDIADDTTVASFADSLKKQVEDTKEFANVLARLHKAGLNDVQYKDLVAQGLSALPFAQQVLAGGKSAIDQINSLESQLGTAAGTLSKTASSELYQAAVDSAAGLVAGLKKQQASIQKIMDQIADAMVSSLKKKLGIKSPSKVLATVGKQSGQGLVNGLDSMASAVDDSASNIGDTAITSLSKSLSGFSDLITGPVDIQPTVTPVLDLSGIKKDAGKIGGMISTRPITVGASYTSAVGAALGIENDQAPVNTIAPHSPIAPFTFNQYNNSPVALSAAEIYRQTKNQLSRTKGTATY
jgi:tape measure domain-containing protein